MGKKSFIAFHLKSCMQILLLLSFRDILHDNN